jgi:hypothetical protein
VSADDYVMRANFLATVKDMGEGDEIADAMFRLVCEVEEQLPAPWADSDPFAAERWLAAHGASPAMAAKNAAEFEISARALVALKLGRPVETFDELAQVFEEVLGAADG